MKLRLIILLFVIYSRFLFSTNFEFGIGGSVGATSEFSYVLDRKESYMASGDRVDSGYRQTPLLILGLILSFKMREL